LRTGRVTLQIHLGQWANAGPDHNTEMAAEEAGGHSVGARFAATRRRRFPHKINLVLSLSIGHTRAAEALRSYSLFKDQSGSSHAEKEILQKVPQRMI
jgi:hypothetical protein